MAINKNKIVAQAQRLTAKGQFEKAIGEYQKLLKAVPNDIRTWLKIGDLYTRMGARKEATDTYLRVAEQYTQSGFHLKAVAVYKQVLKLDPTLVEIHGFLADSYLELGLTSEALIQLEQLADIFQRTNNDQNLLKILMRMGEIDSHNIATRLRIAEYLSRENRATEAVEHFSIACEELKKQGRVDDYLKVAERLLYHDSTQVAFAADVAKIYLERRQHKHALSKLQMCFVKNPRDLDTLSLLAEVFKGLNQPEKAVSVYKEMSILLSGPENEQRRRAVFETILELDPENTSAREGLGIQPQKQTPTAAEVPVEEEPTKRTSMAPEPAPERIEELSEEELEHRTQEVLSETEVLIKYGLIERAADHLQKLFEFDPYNIDARERLKGILLDLGRTEEALEQLFTLAEVFKETQPEGSIYYLHDILRLDSNNQRARQMITELGGIMPEDLDETHRIDDTQSAMPTIEETDDEIVVLDEEPLEPGADISDLDEPAFTPAPEPPTAQPTPDTDGYDFENEPFKAPADAQSVVSDLDWRGPATARKTATDNADEMVASIVLPDINDDLEELDFFIEQELFEEAEGLLEGLVAQYPNDHRVIVAMEAFKKARDSEGAVSEEPPREPHLPSFAPGLIEQQFNLENDGKNAVEDEVSETVGRSRVDVQDQISDSDFSTHYDLGLAYKEMGLLEDAITEFQIASGDRGKIALTKQMIGMCYAGLERMDDAVNVFKEGLGQDNLEEQQERGLLYELGVVYQMMGKRDEALDCFHKINNQDSDFADVPARIETLTSGRVSTAPKRGVFD
ncbi:MAG: tetratricopeptide repeat protein [Deltaproteobacteria bacterium]|nr:tetratricopeptide repeat protein [Deltaproteobacteria bacterium]